MGRWRRFCGSFRPGILFLISLPGFSTSTGLTILSWSIVETRVRAWSSVPHQRKETEKMHRYFLVGALLVAGCQNIVGPFQHRQPERVDDRRTHAHPGGLRGANRRGGKEEESEGGGDSLGGRHGPSHCTVQASLQVGKFPGSSRGCRRASRRSAPRFTESRTRVSGIETPGRPTAGRIGCPCYPFGSGMPCFLSFW